MKAWAILVVGGLASLRCSPEAPRQSPPAAAPVVTSVPVTAAPLDALIAYVPPEAVAVVAIDLERARRSPVLSRVVELLIAQMGQDASITPSARALVIARMPAPSSVLVVIAGDVDDALFGPPAVVERSRAAHAGASAAETGGLRDALLAVHGGPAGVAAVQMTAELQAVARGVLPDLASAAWFAGALDVTSGVKVTGIGAFPDLTTAVRIAASADLGKSFALGQLRSTDPVAAGAIERVFARPVGATLQFTATFDDAEALALLALLH